MEGLEPIVREMRQAATALLDELSDDQRVEASRPFADDAARRHFTYMPGPRPGVCLADMDRAARKLTHRLLATVLSSAAFAQAMAVMALEEVLDLREGGRRGRHSNDFWVVLFGDPSRDARWSWRLEGHHLSATVTIDGDLIFPTPLFLGANPARVSAADRPVLRPLGPEEDLARELLDAMPPAVRRRAIVSDGPPPDIRSSTASRAHRLSPLGVLAAELDDASWLRLHQLVGVYLGRLRPELAHHEAAGVSRDDLYFAWEGSPEPGRGHYYRIQGPDLLIEYDNTANGANHAHTVLRRPSLDFGHDVLAAHLGAGRTGPQGAGQLPASRGPEAPNG